MIGETITHYKILSRLGAGGMGVVYEAEDTRLGRKVALKFLPDEANADPDAIQRFQREARVISNLNHPHICTLYDIGSHQGRQFMVMELLDGQSLKDRIAKGAMPTEEVLELGAQMADALDAAHAQGVIHRDIKPANLFITRRGSMKILDFGVAKLAEGGRTDPSATMATGDQLTTIGTTIGTIAYMSPEQARGQEIDARSDLFSAGVVLYEMAAAQLPFPGTTAASIFEGLLTKAPTPPSQIKPALPDEFDHIVLKALEKDRDTRYQGAAEMRADLKRLKRSLETGTAIAAATAAVAPPPAVKSSSWRKPVFIGVPLITAAMVGALIFYKSAATPALTREDTVLLSSIVNRTGDTMFDDTLNEALALQLRQSPFLHLVPEQEVQGTLRLMERDPMTPVVGDVGREVCQRTGAKALLGGSVAMLGSSYVITLNAQDCVQGKVLAEEQAQAATKESVLASMGTAVTAFRQKLGESLASVQRYDSKIEEATTTSLEALKAYSQGQRTRRTTGDFDAVPFFRRAIELDPDFALAYARLGTVYGNLGQLDEGKKMTARAYELREKVSEQERLYIEARYYSTVENNLQKAIDTYNVWLGTYPDDYIALVNSALLHKQRGDLNAAIKNLEVAIKVAPDQPLAWTNLGQSYFDAGKYEDAKRVMETAIKVQDSTSARIGMYQAAIMLGDDATAEQQVAAVRGRRDEVEMFAIRMFAASYRGRFKEAADLVDDFQARSVALSRATQAGSAIMQLAVSEAVAGLADQAKARSQKAEADGILGENEVADRLVIAAITRDAATARALYPKALELMKKRSQPEDPNGEAVRAMDGLLKLAEGKASEAATAMEPVPLQPSQDANDVISIWALAKFQANDFASAAKGFDYLTSTAARRGLSASAPFTWLMHGRTHAALGQKEEARKSYQKFFAIWKDADPDVPLLLQAREEFAKLAS